MNTIEQFRKEAYRVWGISNKEVIYDVPKYTIKLGLTKFKFQVNYDSIYKAWPRTYKLSIPVFENGILISNKIYSRTLMPIILFKENNSIKFKVKAWYDMSDDLHKQLITILEKSFYKISPIQKTINWFLPKSLKCVGKINKENYIYEVVNTNNEYTINIVN